MIPCTTINYYLLHSALIKPATKACTCVATTST